MWQKIKLSLKTKCYLCGTYFDQSRESYVLYKCFFCKKFTHYCFFCSLKSQKIFYRENFFKCLYCNKLTNSLDKIVINPCFQNYFKESNNSFIINNNLTAINKGDKKNKIISKNNQNKDDNYISLNNKCNKNERKVNYLKNKNYIINSNKMKIFFNSNNLSAPAKPFIVRKFMKIYGFSLRKNKIKAKTFENYNSFFLRKKNKFDCRNKVLEYKNHKERYFFKKNNNNFINEKIELKPAVSNFRIKEYEFKNKFLIKYGSYGFSLFNDSNIKSSLFIHESKWDDFEKLKNIFN